MAEASRLEPTAEPSPQACVLAGFAAGWQGLLGWLEPWLVLWNDPTDRGKLVLLSRNLENAENLYINRTASSSWLR
jgi:hypothetical protein